MGKRFFDIQKSPDEQVTGPFWKEPAQATGKRTETPGKRMPSGRTQKNTGRTSASNDVAAERPSPSTSNTISRADRQLFSDLLFYTKPTVNAIPVRVGAGDRHNSDAANSADYDGYTVKLTDYMKNIRNIEDSFNSRYTENYDDVYHGDAADYANEFHDIRGALNTSADTLLKDIEALRGAHGDEWARSAASNVIGRVSTVNSLAGFVNKDAANWSRFEDETDYSAAMFGDSPASRYGSTFEAAQRAKEGSRTLSADATRLKSQNASADSQHTPHIFVDPALAEAQRAQEEKRTAISVDPALAEAQKIYDRYQNSRMIDPALVEAQKWHEFLHPEEYPDKSDSVDVTPGDDGKNNPYGIAVNEFLRWAYSQLGYHEKASKEDLNDKLANIGGNTDNWTKYGEWYDEFYNTSGFNHEAWCAMFASWCAMKSGIPEDEIYRTASTSVFINWYKEHDRLEDEDYEPKAGDLIFYQWTNTDGSLGGHTGIVVGYEPAETNEDIAYVYTIEGNWNDEHGVYFRQVPMNKPNIKGFGVNGGNSLGIIPAV